MTWDRLRAEQAAEAEARAAERAAREEETERALTRTKRRWAVGIAVLALVIAVVLVRQARVAQRERHERTQVSISTRPAGAEVLFRMESDPTFRRANRTTPAEIAVPNGEYVFRFERDWCHPEERSLVLEGGSTGVNVDFHEFGNLRVDSSPKGAHVRYRKQGSKEFIDLDETTPTRIVDLDAGTYEIDVRLDGYRLVDATSPLATVVVGRTNAWIARFEKASGRRAAAPKTGPKVAVETSEVATPSLPARPPERDDGREVELLRLEAVPARNEIRIPAAEPPDSPAPESLLSKPSRAEPREGYVRLSLEPYVDPTNGIPYAGAILLDGLLVSGDPQGVVVPVGLGRSVSLVAENDRIFGRRAWPDLEVALGDTTDLGVFEFETEELIVGTRPIASSLVTIDGRTDPRRARTPYRQRIATGTHKVMLVPPAPTRVLAGEIEYLDTGEVETFPSGVGADTVTFELKRGRPCRIIFVVN